MVEVYFFRLVDTYIYTALDKKAFYKATPANQF